MSQEMVRYRMKVVDENMSIREIEDKIGHGLVEELIFAAHNELRLLKIMKAWRPWDHMLNSDQEEKENLLRFANFRSNHAFASAFEGYDAEHHSRPARKDTANIHPEDK